MAQQERDGAIGRAASFRPVEGVYVYFRRDGNGKVMVALNRNAQATALKLDRFASMLGPDRRGRDVVSGQTVSLKDTLQLMPHAATILEIR